MPTALNIGKPALTRGNWEVEHHEVTAAQTFKVGDWVYLDSSGTLVIAAAASNDVGNVLLLGIAGANAADVLDSNIPTANQKCPVWVPQPGASFLTQLTTQPQRPRFWPTLILTRLQRSL